MAPKRGSDGRFRSSGGSVTGGTGDIKPQIMTVAVDAPAAINNYSIEQFNTPRITRAGGGFGDTFSTVMEILSVDWYLGIEDAADVAEIHSGFLSFRVVRTQNQTATAVTFAADLALSSVFAGVLSFENTLTSGAHSWTMPIHVNLTDNNGNGVLIATDRLFATTGSVQNGIASSGVAKILYRMTNIGLAEYIGIVQAQSVP